MTSAESLTSPDQAADWDQQQRNLGASFFQSSYWANFQRSLGHEVYTLSGQNWSCLLISHQSRAGGYLLAPYGPTLATVAALAEALDSLTEFGRELGVSWLRLEPCLSWPQATELTDSLASSHHKLVPAPKHYDPGLTRYIDLRVGEAELFANLTSSIRNTVRKNQQSQKVSVRASQDPADIESYIEMMHVVATRNHVFFHPDSYYRKQAQSLMPLGTMRIAFAYYEGQPIAGMILHRFGDTIIYSHAASLPIAREVNAADILLWEAIRQAVTEGLSYLDLFGVAPDDAPPSHPWYGFTAFKRKFGGRLLERGNTTDVILNANRYRLYRSALKAHKLIKRR